MAKKDFFITFTVVDLFQGDKKFAVRCKDMDETTEVGSDACSRASIKNVRVRQCGKPSNRNIMSYDDYWKYDEWM